VKIGIVGSGLAGFITAYAIVMKGFGTEIVMIDKDVSRAGAEAADILHAVPFGHSVVIGQGAILTLRGAPWSLWPPGGGGSRASRGSISRSTTPPC